MGYLAKGAAAIAALAILTSACLASTVRSAPKFPTLQSAADWINNYRRSHDLTNAPYAIRAVSFYGGLKDADTSGTYVGFIAGIIGSNPDDADRLIGGMLPVRPEDQWAIVRGIAYSGHPQWKALLRKYADKLDGRRTMIADYINERLPTLDQLSIKPGPTTLAHVKKALAIDWRRGPKPKQLASLEPTQDVLDTLWGYYLASGSYGPVVRIVALLPWSKDRDEVERLTVGSMAKYTLATNASRDPELLEKLTALRAAKSQNKETKALLDEVIRAAQVADTAKLRRDALAAIEQLKIKGPNYKREVNTWALVGQGALAVGCVTAAALGQIEFGIPCVVGGGATSAAMYYMRD